MLLDRSLNIALLISMVLHTAILLSLPQLKSSSLKRSLQSLNVTYVVPKEVIPTVKHQVNEEKVSSELKENKEVAIQSRAVKKISSAPKPIEHPAKIEIPPELPKEKETLYLSYYQTIRERIRALVLDNYHRYVACGEVCLYFILLSDGQLKEIRIVDERSSPNRLLKEIAKRSVQQASPFSPFPKDLNQQQLSFNVIISFELEN